MLVPLRGPCIVLDFEKAYFIEDGMADHDACLLLLADTLPMTVGDRFCIYPFYDCWVIDHIEVEHQQSGTAVIFFYASKKKYADEVYDFHLAELELFAKEMSDE